MILSIDNPLYNTIIVFTIIMTLIFFIKPEVLYDENKKEFRQFGMSKGKTLMPIYIFGLLLAILIYILFYCICEYKKIPKIKKNNINNSMLCEIQEYKIKKIQNKIDKINKILENNNRRLLPNTLNVF